jgi:hypothetical protein
VEQKADAKKLKLNPGFLKFYKTHDQLSNLSSSELHAAWAAVVSHLPKVLYKQPEENSYCNITGGLASVLKVFGQLIFTTDSWETMNRKEQFDLIAEFFSRPDFLLQWDTNTLTWAEHQYGTLHFTVNGIPSFDWTFNCGHFYITQKNHPKADWRKLLGKPLTQAFDHEDNTARSLGLLTWFIDSENLVEFYSLLKSKNSAEQQLLLLSLPLEHEATKVFAIELILENKWERLYPIVPKLLPDGTLNNLQLASKLVNTILAQGAKDKEIDLKGFGFKKIVSSYFENFYPDPSQINELFFFAIDHHLCSLIPAIIHEIPMVLLKKNPDDGATPLHFAIRQEDVKIVELLLQAGADPNQLDENRGRPLNYAVKKCLHPIVDLLLDHGAEIGAQEKTGRTALHSAAAGNHLDIVKLLVSRGAPLELQDQEGRTPLGLAQGSKHEKIIEFLENQRERQNTGISQEIFNSDL